MSSALALEVYARKMERTRDTGERMDALGQITAASRGVRDRIGESRLNPQIAQ
jgi:hypothetical protein